MSLPPALLAELVEILRSVARHEAAACGVELSEECLASIAGNAVQVMCAPLELWQRGEWVAPARPPTEPERPVSSAWLAAMRALRGRP